MRQVLYAEDKLKEVRSNDELEIDAASNESAWHCTRSLNPQNFTECGLKRNDNHTDSRGCETRQ